MTDVDDEGASNEAGHRAAQPQVALANERTFLSWVRTALALIVSGAALTAFSMPVPEGWRTAAGAVLAGLGIVAAVQAWVGWRATDRALAAGEDLPALRVGVYLTGGVVVAVVILAVGALWGGDGG
ncbi:DUF202 domain-containing protein [Demequina sp. TTPB684]|uniref:YidH family protein n=1 Tax=unclassified Demequina TaxID=2620311 RepID=UPI001CF4CEF1|nr:MULTISPECIES: DUF202 domain-containing protein [unclassified Demequina]MCB2412329.1 DUF202 domain-containing protein [Demequina sp. TTPB684]UPU89476.1 DUF202 domain-containing protein [Demequina sp. TMPB413]